MDSRRNWRNLLGLFHGNAKTGFGIVEVMVSIVVLGFMYVALSKLQSSNHDSFLRIRGRDGAVEVAQQVMDELKSKGAAAIPSASTENTVYSLDPIERKWERGLGGDVTVAYTPTITVSPANDYVAQSGSMYENVNHVYAKKVNVRVMWNFKGTTHSIDISGVIR